MHQNLKPGHICVDCTLGGAGHALSTIRAILPDGMLIGIDQDIDAIDHATAQLSPYKDHVRLFHSNFSDLPRILSILGIAGANAIVLDLGFSLNQLKHSKRGFSFNQNEPLEMRMDIRNPLTASEIVNSFPENELAGLFFKYGEEKYSRSIARKIVEERTKAPIQTSQALSQVIVAAVPKKSAAKQRIHPATRVFQALRIAVNNELGHLESFMDQAPSFLLKGGRLCVISFHSLEDRIVKQSLRRFENGCTCSKSLPKCQCGFVPSMKSVFRKALVASREETEQNPMARSAKLRVAEKV